MKEAAQRDVPLTVLTVHDLVVVDTRGGGGFPHLRLGAVSCQVVHHAKCPIVVVPYDR